MSGGAGRTLDAWRADALRVLATATRKLGLDGLRRSSALKALLNILGQEAVALVASGAHERVPAPARTPTKEEFDAALAEAPRLLHEYLRLKALFQAEEAGTRAAAATGADTVTDTVTATDTVTVTAPDAVTVTAPETVTDTAAVTATGSAAVPGSGSGTAGRVRFELTLPMLVDPLFARQPPAPPPGQADPLFFAPPPPPPQLRTGEVKAPPRPAPRDLESDAALGRIRERQEAAMTRFFAAPAADPGRPEEPAAWEARLELDGDLFLVAGPLAGLPRFVRTLDVVSGDTRTTVLAANLRSGVCRVRVPPSPAGYSWSAGALDEELGEELAALALAGLSADRATLFRVDALGAGQRLSGTALSPERAYRALVPPGLEVEGIAPEDVRALGGGWRAVELCVPSPVPPGGDAALRRLGLSVAGAALEVDLVGVAAREHREGRGGVRYACFRPEDAPVVRVAGVETWAPGHVVLFLAGPRGQERFPLPAGKEHLVQLGPLAPGRYALDALSLDPAIEPERMLFEVTEGAGRAPERAEAAVELGGERIAIEGEVIRELDLGGLDERGLRILTPPLWRVGARWEGARSRPLSPLFADARGEVRAAELLGATRAEREAERVGDLRLDFGDLGALWLRHTRQPALGALRAALLSLLAEREAAVAEEADLGLLRAVWLEPICRALGYEVREAAPLEGAGFLVLALETTAREGDRITTERHAALVLGRRGIDLGSTAPGSARDAASRLSRRDGYARVILTDGFAWALWERGRAFAPAPIDLRGALQEGAEGRFEELISRFHA